MEAIRSVDKQPHRPWQDLVFATIDRRISELGVGGVAPYEDPLIADMRRARAITDEFLSEPSAKHVVNSARHVDPRLIEPFVFRPAEKKIFRMPHDARIVTRRMTVDPSGPYLPDSELLARPQLGIETYQLDEDTLHFLATEQGDLKALVDYYEHAQIDPERAAKILDFQRRAIRENDTIPNFGVKIRQQASWVQRGSLDDSFRGFKTNPMLQIDLSCNSGRITIIETRFNGRVSKPNRMPPQIVSDDPSQVAQFQDFIDGLNEIAEETMKI